MSPATRQGKAVRRPLAWPAQGVASARAPTRRPLEWPARTAEPVRRSLRRLQGSAALHDYLVERAVAAWSGGQPLPPGDLVD